MHPSGPAPAQIISNLIARLATWLSANAEGCSLYKISAPSEIIDFLALHADSPLIELSAEDSFGPAGETCVAEL